MKPFADPIYVARPSLPPLAEYVRSLEEIWECRWVTNKGPMLERFESKLVNVLQVNDISLFTNGTLALSIGVQALGLSGEVITTPFTFAASTNALLQNAITPVFADIDRHSLTLDPDSVEAAITPRTTGILAVHLFGRPCQLDRLAAIARKYGLALVYDAAHAFGVTVGGRSIATFGDLSMFSFHATKPFHSIEGGALAFPRLSLKSRCDTLCNHGLEADGDVLVAGTNAKMTEFQAAMGILMLDRFAAAIEHMGKVAALYRCRLAAIAGVETLPPPGGEIVANNAFMPVLVDETAFGMSRDALQAALGRFNVYARPYFYPLICDMRGYRHMNIHDPLTIARDIARKVLAVPTYADLSLDDVHRICDLIAFIQKAGPDVAPPSV